MLTIGLLAVFLPSVPALFRWLSQKYPKIVSSVLEEHPDEIEGEVVPVDYTKPNPNGEVISPLQPLSLLVSLSSGFVLRLT